MVDRRTLGFGAVVLALLLSAGGWMGFTLTGAVDDVPTPNVPARSFFADEPLPEQVLSPFLSAELTLTWDRDDVYVVVVDEDEKNTCDATPSALIQNTGNTACGPYDEDVVAISDDGGSGLAWVVDPGVHYVGVGTSPDTTLPQGAEVNLQYSVHLRAGFAAYFVFAIIGAFGFAYGRSQ